MRLIFLGFITAVGMLFGAPGAAARADVNGYPCSLDQGQGIGAQVVVATGQFCDGPTEINLSHAHCEGGGANVGAFGLAGQNGISLGAIGSSGIGGAGCSYRCPDGTVAPQPNPPGMWHNYLDVRKIIKANKAFCVREGHLTAAGPTSELVRPEEGDPDMDRGPSSPAGSTNVVPGHQGAVVVPTPNGTLPIPLPGLPSIP